MLRHSRAGARLDADALPRSAILAAQPRAVQRECTLAGGDDYELLFTAAPADAQAVRRAAAQGGVAVTRIGSITGAAHGLQVVDAQGRSIAQAFAGFDHFRT